jgi:hypothetical protein
LKNQELGEERRDHRKGLGSAGNGDARFSPWDFNTHRIGDPAMPRGARARRVIPCCGLGQNAGSIGFGDRRPGVQSVLQIEQSVKSLAKNHALSGAQSEPP